VEGYLWQHSNPTIAVRDDATRVVGGHSLGFGVHVVAAQKNELDTGGGGNTGDVQGLLTFSNVNSLFTPRSTLSGGYLQDSSTGTPTATLTVDRGVPWLAVR